MVRGGLLLGASQGFTSVFWVPLRFYALRFLFVVLLHHCPGLRFFDILAPGLRLFGFFSPSLFDGVFLSVAISCLAFLVLSACHMLFIQLYHGMVLSCVQVLLLFPGWVLLPFFLFCSPMFSLGYGVALLGMFSLIHPSIVLGFLHCAITFLTTVPLYPNFFLLPGPLLCCFPLSHLRYIKPLFSAFL